MRVWRGFGWPKEDPVGRAIRLGGPNGPRLTVVGVVGDVPIRGLDEPLRRQFFRPYTQAAWPVMNIVVRTATAPITFTAPIKKALAEVLPDRPVSQVETMEDIVRDSTGSRRFPMLLLTAFSLLALVLAAVGIIGVVSYSVTQRTRELGIRMALGARSGDVLSLVFAREREMGVTRDCGRDRRFDRFRPPTEQHALRSAPDRAAVLGAVSALLTGVALIASYLPARHATKVDPTIALRYE